MDRDGRNKKDLTAGSKEFAYGFEASPDGTQIAYHKSYQVFITNADGSGAKRVETGQPFNFVLNGRPMESGYYSSQVNITIVIHISCAATEANFARWRIGRVTEEW